MAGKLKKSHAFDRNITDQPVTGNVEDTSSQFLMAVGKRIATLADKVGNRKKLAELAGISEGHLYRYIRGASEAGIKPIVAIAKAGGVTTDWLLTGEGSSTEVWAHGELQEPGSAYVSSPRSPHQTSDFDDFVLIPQLDVALSAGSGMPVEQDLIRSYLAFRRNWVARISAPESLAILTVHGDSMEPTLRDGDAVMVHKERTRLYGANICALRMDGLLLVKRLQLLSGGGMQIISDNPLYPMQTVQQYDETVQILGQVVWMGRKLI